MTEVIYLCMYMCPFSPGLQVIEVAHDMQLAVRRYLKQELNLVNSFDTWHGMKLTVMVFSQDVCTGVTTLHRNQECCQRARQNHTRSSKRSRCDLVY